jgi:hypothetical protein
MSPDPTSLDARLVNAFRRRGVDLRTPPSYPDRTVCVKDRFFRSA